MTDAYDIIAKFYDLVSSADDDDIDLYDAFARRLDLPVLELGCGTGRVAIALAERGHQVHGIDRSPAMLDIARERALSVGASLHFHQGDARQLALGQEFGLVFWAADGFLHLDGSAAQQQALQVAAAHLADGGRLVLDLPAPTGAWADWQPGIRPLELLWSGAGPDGLPLQYFAGATVDPVAQTRQVTHLFDQCDAGGRVTRTAVSFTLRFVFPAEARLLIEAAGLVLEDLYGSYQLDPCSADASRMIIVARRGG